MPKKIISVGINLASDDVSECDFDSNTSLLDWDIVLFKPEISSFCRNSEHFQGKICLTESPSFRLKERTEHWRREIKEAVQSGKTVFVFLPQFQEIFIDSEGECTPEPLWAQAPEFTLRSENELRAQLLKLEEELERLQRSKEGLMEQISNAGRLRGLLFEKGRPLEAAIIDAPKILGFEASPYKESNSEFDVIFESTEGRLLGEAEGKDSKAINVDKLRQLSMNIHEDLQREEVSAPAKGVLFGNAHRLLPLPERGPSFTEKCVSASLTSSTALVSTGDLFRVASYLANDPDDDFAMECRKALVTGNGLVCFPSVPASSEQEPSISADGNLS